MLAAATPYYEPLDGQLVLLLHHDDLERRRLTQELTLRGCVVFPLESTADLLAYLDLAAEYDARTTFPDLLLAEETTLGREGIERLIAMRRSDCALPVVLIQ